MVKKIKINFGPTGKIKVEAEGYVGDSCKEATRPIIERLGRVVDDVNKPEFYETKESEQEGVPQW